jgi:hypothetical protein
LSAGAHAIASGLHLVVAVLTANLAQIEESSSTRTERNFTVVGVVVSRVIAVHGAAGNARLPRIANGVKRRVQARKPIGNRLVAQLRTVLVGIGANGTGADNQKQSDQSKAKDGIHFARTTNVIQLKLVKQRVRSKTN